MALSLLFSIAIHAAALVGFAASVFFRWPTLPLPIEVVSAHRRVHTIGPREERADPKSPAPVEKRRQPKPTVGPGAAPPARPSPPATTDLRPFAPDDARVVVLLRTDKLRRSPHRAGIEQLLKALPDYAMLLGGTGLAPLDDFEALLIATADPRSVIATFIAARFHDSPRIRAITTRAIRPGDPRVFRVLKPGLAVLTQPSDAARLDAAPRSDAGTPTAWLSELERFDQIAAGPSAPAVMLTIHEAPALLRFGGGLATPQTLALAITADASPAVRLQLLFASPAESLRLLEEWPKLVKRWRLETALFGLAPALDELAPRQSGAVFELEGRLPEAQLRIALEFVRAFLPAAAESATSVDDAGTLR